MGDARHRIGASGERHAADHYLRLGYRLIATNARTRHGELDIIACRGSLLVIAEVRTRVEGRGDPVDSFDERKRRQVRRMAAQWLSANRCPAGIGSFRIDAVAVVVDRSGELRSLRVLEGAL